MPSRDEPAGPQDLLIRAEDAYPGGTRLPSGQPGDRRPVDNDPAGDGSGPGGDDRFGLPRGQAYAALGVVLVPDADHISGLEEPRRHVLIGHDVPPGDTWAASAYNWMTPRRQRRITGTALRTRKLGSTAIAALGCYSTSLAESRRDAQSLLSRWWPTALLTSATTAAATCICACSTRARGSWPASGRSAHAVMPTELDHLRAVARTVGTAASRA